MKITFQPICLAVLTAIVALSLFWASAPQLHAQEAPAVSISRVPEGGLQPQVVVKNETVHLLYFQGDPKAGDLFYARSSDGGRAFGPRLRVNSQAGSAIAMGTIRGGQLAVGKSGRVFVVWNGSDQARPRNEAAPATERKNGASPLLYSRLDDAGEAFEPQRNLMTRTFGLDGGGSVASDEEGRVYVAWHGSDKAGQDEGARRVYIVVSNDNGATFEGEKAVWEEPTGACGCCQLRLMAQNGGRVSLLYRSAREMENRDTYFLASKDSGRSFEGQQIHPWRINACPMSSYALLPNGETSVAAWESSEQIYFSNLSPGGQAPTITSAPGSGPNRKHPILSINQVGQILLVWTEGTGWNRGGKLKWQVFDAQNRPIPGATGEKSGVPAWSFAAARSRQDGSFEVLY
jgi:hypothetical protein